MMMDITFISTDKENHRLLLVFTTNRNIRVDLLLDIHMVKQAMDINDNLVAGCSINYG